MDALYEGPEWVHSEDALPLFCPTCGRPMRRTEGLARYDRRTGAPVFKVGARCTKPWWVPGFGHERYVVVTPNYPEEG